MHNSLKTVGFCSGFFCSLGGIAVPLPTRRHLRHFLEELLFSAWKVELNIDLQSSLWWPSATFRNDLEPTNLWFLSPLELWMWQLDNFLFSSCFPQPGKAHATLYSLPLWGLFWWWISAGRGSCLWLLWKLFLLCSFWMVYPLFFHCINSVFEQWGLRWSGCLLLYLAFWKHSHSLCMALDECSAFLLPVCVGI